MYIRLSLNLIQLIILLFVPALQAQTDHPLKPIDTSSPRATINGFYSTTESAYNSIFTTLSNYLKSDRLFLSQPEFSQVLEAREQFISAGRALDVSDLPPAMLGESAKKLSVQLKEILDRLDYPATELAPDARDMENQSSTKWTLPDTEISIEKVTTGSRRGEYLFTAESVTRIHEFYEKIKDQPYRRGSTQGWYENKYQQPLIVALAFHRLLPTRWILADMNRKYPVFLDEPVWRWIGLGTLLGVLLSIMKLGSWIKRTWLSSRTRVKRWMPLIFPSSLVLSIYIGIVAISDILRFGGFVFNFVIPALWVAFYIGMTWLSWQTGEVIAVLIIEAERLNKASINSQLIRLLIRVVTITVAILILVNGAERLGLPAYSVLASLGVGGVAVALAAQQTIANLLGSIIIMLEKPFKIGDSIKIMDMEGVVKSVGFRSTRVATTKGTLVTIPSSQIVNGAVTTHSLPGREPSRNTLSLSIHNGPEKIQDFLLELKRYLNGRPELDKNRGRIEISSLKDTTLEVALDFTLLSDKDIDTASVRQSIYIDVLSLARSKGIEFA